MADEKPLKTLGYLQEAAGVDVLEVSGLTTTETDMFFTDGTTGPISLTALASGGLLDALLDAIGQQANTGVFTGLSVTINGGDPTKFDVAAGEAIVWNSHTDPKAVTFSVVSFAGLMAVARTTGSESPQAKITRLALNSSGTIVQQSAEFSDTQERDLAEFGEIWHPGGDGAAIVSAGPSGNTAQNLGLEHADFRKIFGILRQSGLLYFANGANQKFNRQSGSAFGLGIGGYDSVAARKDTGRVDLGSQTALAFFRVYRDATNGETIDGTFTDWDPAVWDDDSGVLQAFPGADNYGIARMYVGPPTTSFPAGMPVVGVPQATYKTKADALVALTQPIEEREFTGSLMPTTWFVVNKAATDFTVVANAQFFSIPVLFRLGGGGVTAASGAPGVNDFDDLSDTPAFPKVADALVASDAAGTDLEYINTLAALNAKLTDGPVDVNTASRPPSGPTSGDLSGTYPGPAVSAITTTTGPTSLDVLGISDREVLQRFGTAVVGIDGQFALLGLTWAWDTGTADADPGAGKIRGNNATQSSISQLFANDSSGKLGVQAREALLNLGSGTWMFIGNHRHDQRGDWHAFQMSGDAIPATGYVKLPVTHLAGGTDFSTVDEVGLQVVPVASAAVAEADIPLLSFAHSSDITLSGTPQSPAWNITHHVAVDATYFAYPVVGSVSNDEVEIQKKGLYEVSVSTTDLITSGSTANPGMGIYINGVELNGTLAAVFLTSDTTILAKTVNTILLLDVNDKVTPGFYKFSGLCKSFGGRIMFSIKFLKAEA